MALNPVTARLLQLIEENTERRSGRDLLLRLAEEMNYPDPETLLKHGADALNEMRKSEILLGVID